VLWIPGLIGLFGLLCTKMPRYATLGLVVAIYGAVGGAAFSFEGLYTAAFAISQEQAIAIWSAQPLPFNLTLFWPGPLFPLSLLVLAINLTRTKTVPLWAGLLLALGAIAFPVSRIPRIEWIAHSVDLLLLIPAAYLGWMMVRGNNLPAR
jgi:hypothetical protein